LLLVLVLVGAGQHRRPVFTSELLPKPKLRLTLLLLLLLHDLLLVCLQPVKITRIPACCCCCCC
jgi:hypothetical protein